MQLTTRIKMKTGHFLCFQSMVESGDQFPN